MVNRIVQRFTGGETRRGCAVHYECDIRHKIAELISLVATILTGTDGVVPSTSSSGGSSTKCQLVFSNIISYG